RGDVPALRAPAHGCGGARASAGGVASFEEIAPGDERADLRVGDRPLQHPEPAIGMDVADAALADDLLGALDPPSDRIGRLDLRALDVDDAESHADPLVELAEDLQLALRAVRVLHHDVVALEAVEVAEKPVPAALLDRLPAVVAEAEMDRRLALHRAQ